LVIAFWLNWGVDNLNTEKYTHVSAVCGIESKNKDAAINELLEKAEIFQNLKDLESLKHSIVSGGENKNTGLGRGVAIAHAETPQLPYVAIAIGISKDGIEYEAPDGRQVQILFLLVNAAGDCSGYLEALSTITKLMRKQDVRDGVCCCSTKAELEAKFLQAVESL
jgi:mannitol/fructose-specific phosphotransferase system IIA component (Ntr-type)